MSDLLFELFCEEIPAGMQAQALVQLRAQVLGGLESVGLTHDTAETFATPRRLAIFVTGLPARTQDVSVERKGPRTNAPEAAIQGFLKSTGLTLDQLETRGDTYYASIHTAGQQTSEVVKGIVEKAAQSIHWPKSMRWGAHEMRWVRPLKNMLCLLDAHVVPAEIGHLTANNVTFGHRFLAPQAIALTHAKDYKQALEKAFVVLDTELRQRQIAERSQALITAHDLVLKEDRGLLEEVAGLVEYPVVLMGQFEQRYLALPLEVPSTVMKSHQRYFTVLDRNGKLAPHFVFVSNMQNTDGGKTVIAGNERVLRARLADGEFYWQQDVKTPLSSLLPNLATMVFHAKLGSVAEKVARIEDLASLIGKYVAGADASHVGRAAHLCKADLVSGMVGEFPELQGLMGHYYALQQGEPEAVADAIRDHYRPLGPGDQCPTAPVTVALALADKIDTLAGMFAVGEKPTGSKDPFALRRAALGIIRLILENRLRIRLREIFMHAVGRHLADSQRDAVADELMDFIADRLKVMMKEQGLSHDRVNAVFQLAPGAQERGAYTDDLVQLVARAKALAAFLDTQDGKNLLAAYTRARNIVAKANDLPQAELSAVPQAGAQAEEQALHAALKTLENAVHPALQTEDYDVAMRHLATIRPQVDAFFDKVTVNDNDAALRLNRLRLLAYAGQIFDSMANFAVIEG